MTSPSRRLGVVGMLALVFAAGLLGFVVWAFARMWDLAATTRLDANGYAAIGLATTLTLAFAAGMMWLAVYSARKGHDHRQGRQAAIRTGSSRRAPRTSRS